MSATFSAHGSYGYGLQVDKSNRGAHGFKTVEDLAAWKKEEFEWKLSAEKRLGLQKSSSSSVFRSIPQRIHGTSLVYLPIHEWLICRVNVDKYTSPMDLMGSRKSMTFGNTFFFCGEEKTSCFDVLSVFLLLMQMLGSNVFFFFFGSSDSFVSR